MIIHKWVDLALARLAAITALVTVIILYLCGYKRANKHSTGPEPSQQEYETPAVTTSGLEMKSNTAYGQVQQYTVPTDSMYETVTTWHTWLDINAYHCFF